ncbi:methyltransferase family protein [Neptuniibacter sp. QD72_48]|uniref:methyltransferase family protein n=1 Tax=unclassified Neptuniibacter TaxID=2630693 RepID=UPI0039F497FE
MLKLELKIPPVALVLIFAGLMWLCAKLLPFLSIQTELRIPIAVAIILIGLVFGLAGVFSFRKAQTTVNPTTPEASSALVTTGIFQYTRNPMYVGLMCLLLSWASYLANPVSLLCSVGFILYMNKFQIQPEEQALTALFGDSYKTYTQQVRRWL